MNERLAKAKQYGENANFFPMPIAIKVHHIYINQPRLSVLSKISLRVLVLSACSGRWITQGKITFNLFYLKPNRKVFKLVSGVPSLRLAQANRDTQPMAEPIGKEVFSAINWKICSWLRGSVSFVFIPSLQVQTSDEKDRIWSSSLQKLKDSGLSDYIFCFSPAWCPWSSQCFMVPLVHDKHGRLRLVQCTSTPRMHGRITSRSRKLRVADRLIRDYCRIENPKYDGK